MGDYLQYGGQAVVEGVMMRSPRYYAVACRKPDGTIVVREEAVESMIVGRLKWLNKPFLRGTLALIDAMVMGMRALSYSASVQVEGTNPDGTPKTAPAVEPAPAIAEVVTEPAAAEPPASEPAKGKSINDIYIGGTMVLAFLLGLAVFVALPTLLTQFSKTHLGITAHGPLPYRQQVALNAVDGVIRIAIFLGYIAAIGGMKNIRRVFQYHGAEHKAINTLEADQPVVMENCLRSSRIHPRCGTSFIIVVLLASILVHSVFPRPEVYLLRLALHISLIPVVAGLAYEVIKLAGKFRSALPTRILLAPGLWTQRLTTREPDESQVEVAMAALNAVLDRESGAPAAATAGAGHG